MITLTGINKRHGNQILFVDASLQLNPGEKVGLTGPNGAGKSTVFRLIVGEEKPDDGEVALPRRLTIGYFRQDMGEMKGRSVIDEAIAGSGKVGELHHELEQLQHDMSDPDKADDMDRILERYGEVQAQYQDLGGYELEARAKEVLHGLGFHDSQIAGDVGALSGGWKMRVGMAKVLLGDFDVLLMDEPTNHLDMPSVDALILLSPSTSSKGTIAARYPAICPASIRCASPISISRINSRLRIPSRYRARIKPSRAAVICAPFVTARGRPKVPSRTYWEAVGRLATLVPSPSCPFALYPQQRIATAAVTAHVKYCPDVKATVVGGSCCTATNMLRLT